MEVKFDKLDNVTAEMTVSLEEKDYADKVKKQLKEIGKERQEPGFRKGHVPEGILKKKYGAAVKYDVVNKLIGDALFDYIRENKLDVLGQPIADKGNEFKEEAPDFTFKFKVGLAPDFKVTVDKSVHVPYYEIGVTDAMIEGEIKALQQRLGHQVSGEETEPNAVIKGVIAELNPDGSIKEGGIAVENGILAPIHFKDEAQKKLFENKKKGDIVVFNPFTAAGGNEVELSSMLNIDRAEVNTHNGDFNFEITDIIVLKPAELNQEFFDMALGKDRAHNEEELKEEIKKIIANTYQNDSNYKFSIDVKDLLLSQVGNLDFPEEILKEFLMRQHEEVTADNVDEEYKKIIPQLTWDLVKGKIQDQLKVQITDADILNEARGVVIRQLSQYSNGSLSEQLVNHYVDELLKDERSRRNISQTAVERKTYDTIRENVTLDKKNVSLEQFRELLTPAVPAE